MGVGEAVVPGAVSEVLYRRTTAGGGHGREAEGPLDEGPRGVIGGAGEAAAAAGGVRRVEIEGADEVDGIGAGEPRGQLTRRGGRETQEVLHRAGGSSGGGEEEEGEERSPLTGGPHGVGGEVNRRNQKWGDEQSAVAWGKEGDGNLETAVCARRVKMEDPRVRESR